MAAQMAAQVRAIKEIDSFPPFLEMMGVAVPCKSNFTSFLRRMVETSSGAGYSQMPLSQGEALYSRGIVEPAVERGDIACVVPSSGKMQNLNFFPRRGKSMDNARGSGKFLTRVKRHNDRT